MLKHKKFLSLLLILPFFAITSCAKPKEKYPVIKEDEKLVINATLPPSLKDGEKLPIDAITVTYDAKSLTWLGEKNKAYETVDTFFLTTSANYPTNSIVTNLKVTTNVERNDLIFYVAHFENQNVYVSSKLKITITNANAIKPWVWYTITGVVIFGVIAMVVFTRRYKAKKEGKL